MAERGPIGPIPPTVTGLIDLGPPLRGRVAADLAFLPGVDGALRSAADRIAHAFVGSGDAGMLAELSELAWQVGDLNGILTVGQLDTVTGRVGSFEHQLEDSEYDITH